VRRPPVACIAWAPSESRPRAIAIALGGEARAFYDLGIVRQALVPLRYLLSAARTLLYLARRRPRAVMIQAPPVPAAALVWGYGRLARVPVVIDSHTAAFALNGARVDRTMMPLLGWLARRVDACIVTTDELGERITRWGGRPIVVHEPPPPWDDVDATSNGAGPSVLFVSTFAPDEPLDAVLAAAELVPEATFRITGDLRLLAASARDTAPANVEWTGYLRGSDYPRALATADVVLTLDERDQTVARSAYEAVYAERPLITTDRPHLRELFPYAVTVDNEPNSIATGVRAALERAPELAAATGAARELQDRRWTRQLEALRTALAGRGAA
jgi:glycosyltransferase involved in cell wall biosynthesis